MIGAASVVLIIETIFLQKIVIPRNEDIIIAQMVMPTMI